MYFYFTDYTLLLFAKRDYTTNVAKSNNTYMYYQNEQKNYMIKFNF